MLSVKPVPPMVPLMSAIGRDGSEEAVPLVEGDFGTRPVAATWNPPAVPLIELMVGVRPVAPFQVIVAVPRPRGILDSRAIKALLAVANRIRTAPPARRMVAVRRARFRPFVGMQRF